MSATVALAPTKRSHMMPVHMEMLGADACGISASPPDLQLRPTFYSQFNHGAAVCVTYQSGDNHVYFPFKPHAPHLGYRYLRTARFRPCRLQLGRCSS